MPSISLLPIKARTELARSLFRDVTNVNDYYHVFFGHALKWNSGTEIAQIYADDLFDMNRTHKDLLAVKRIEATDIVYMVRRIDWTTGTMYDRYDDSVDLSTKNFYVYNSSNSCIYKCLNRQDYIDGSVPVPSTVLPSNTSPEKFATADGYWWRLIYYVPAPDAQKFLTSSYIPVRFFSSSTNFNVSGSVSSFKVVDGGLGYLSPPTVTIVGDGKGASATTTIVDGTVTAITVVNAGSGYSWASALFESASGTNASAVVNLVATDPPEGLNVAISAAAQANAGAIDFVDILNINTGGGGTGYTPETVFSMTGDGTGATLAVTFGAIGNVQSITVGATGNQYTFAAVTTAGDGSAAQLRPIMTPLYGHGGNVPAELFATTIGISVSVEDLFPAFFLNNDFRQVGLIKNINQYGILGGIYSNDTGDASYTIQVSDVAKYHDDDLINTDSGGLFTVVQISGNLVKLLPVIDAISESSVLFNTTTSASLAAMVSGSLIFPQINSKTGDIVYLQNFLPIERQTNQTETVTFYLNF